MLRITAREQDAKLTLVLEGKLAGPWVAELAQAWSEWQGRVARPDTVVDLREVWFIDDAGRELLTTFHAEGAGLVGSGCYVGPIVQSILRGRELGGARLRFLWRPLAALAATASLAAAEPMPISLAQALELALTRNPEVHKSLLAVAQSQDERRMAASELLPSVEGVAVMTRTQANLDALLGAPAPGYLLVGPFSSGSFGVGANVPLFDLSLWKKWKAAGHGEQGAQAQSKVVREAIAALVVGQYLRCQRAEESVKAAGSRVELAAALEKLAEDQQKNGLGTSLDTLRAQVQLQNERQRLIQARTQVRTAHYGLVKLLDLEPGADVALTDPLNAPELPAFSFQEAYGKGLKQRPEVAALDAREQVAGNLRESARDLRIPTLTLSGNFASMGLYPGQPWVNTYQVSLGLRVPLFTGGLISARTARAQVELDRVKEERKELTAQVGLEVQVAQAELDSARSEVDVATQAAAFAQEALVQSRHRFEAGVSNNIEVINAQDELARASDNRINALYRLNQSRADLAKAMGQLEPLFAH